MSRSRCHTAEPPESPPLPSQQPAHGLGLVARRESPKWALLGGKKRELLPAAFTFPYGNAGTTQRRTRSPSPSSQHQAGSEGACRAPKTRMKPRIALNPRHPRSKQRSKAPRSPSASSPPPQTPLQPQQPAAAPPSLCLRHGRAARSSRIFFFMKRLRKRNHLPLSSRRRKDAFNESLQLAPRGSARGFRGWGEVTFAFKSLFHR